MHLRQHRQHHNSNINSQFKLDVSTNVKTCWITRWNLCETQKSRNTKFSSDTNKPVGVVVGLELGLEVGQGVFVGSTVGEEVGADQIDTKIMSQQKEKKICPTNIHEVS